MIYLQLFLSFFQIGLFSFGGGYAAMPLIQAQIVTNHGWLSMSEFTDLVTIAEMTPGPIGLNCATFAGMRVAGIMGSVISMLGMLMPTFTICALAAVFFQKFKDSKVLKDIMLGVRPTALGIIFAVMITLSLTNYTLGGAFSLRALAVGILALVLLTGKLRPNAKETFAYFARQGVTVKVISGDNPATVSQIAQQAGIPGSECYIDAATLDTPEKIREAALHYTVFGRVTPQQKKDLVAALQKKKHVVAMTGDGVNDLLAMKQANCSIAMASGAEAASSLSSGFLRHAWRGSRGKKGHQQYPAVRQPVSGEKHFLLLSLSHHPVYRLALSSGAHPPDGDLLSGHRCSLLCADL